MEAYNIIPEWNELVFRNLTIENLPEYNEDVLVTNGICIWVDSFDEDADGVYLSGTDSEIDGVTAWMPLPNPYKGEEQ